MKVKLREDYQGIKCRHSVSYKLYYHYSNKKITDISVHLKDSEVQFLGIGLKTATVAQPLYSKDLNYSFVLFLN